MPKKYYVVWVGRKPGIYTDWDTCNKQVDKFAGAKHKSFKTLKEAEQEFSGDGDFTKRGDKLKQVSARNKKASIKEIKTYTEKEISEMDTDTKIFTDGACEPNPGEAGSGIAIYRDGFVDELWYGLYNPGGTNNTAELNALYQALHIAKKEIKKKRSVAIFCDSSYSIQCVTKWASQWKKNGWKKKSKKIKNLKLIKEMFALYEPLETKVQLLHVNGHVGIEGNELADRMSMMAIEFGEDDFVLYDEEIDIQEILAMRAG